MVNPINPNPQTPSAAQGPIRTGQSVSAGVMYGTSRGQASETGSSNPVAFMSLLPPDASGRNSMASRLNDIVRLANRDLGHLEGASVRVSVTFNPNGRPQSVRITNSGNTPISRDLLQRLASNVAHDLSTREDVGFILPRGQEIDPANNRVDFTMDLSARRPS